MYYYTLPLTPDPRVQVEIRNDILGQLDILQMFADLLQGQVGRAPEGWLKLVFAGGNGNVDIGVDKGQRDIDIHPLPKGDQPLHQAGGEPAACAALPGSLAAPVADYLFSVDLGAHGRICRGCRD